MAFLWEKVKTVDFSETIAASDLKVGRSRHINEFMKVSEYGRSRSFFDLGPRSCTYKNWKLRLFYIGKNENSGFFRKFCSQ